MAGGSDSPPDLEHGNYQHLISLADTIENRNSMLRPTSEWCIYRVPNRLRRVNKMAYTPLVVSIGPIHHGNEELIAMEEHKWRFLRQFVEKTKVNLRAYIALVKSRESEIRDYYADFIPFSSDKFVDLILLDAVFIIEIMLILDNHRDFGNENGTPYFFNKPWAICQNVLPDLRLLENQIPFFIIKEIYELGGAELEIPMKELCEKFMKDHLFVLMEADKQRDGCIGEMKHFIDGLRKLCLPPKSKNGSCDKRDIVKMKHCVETLGSLCIPPSDLNVGKGQKVKPNKKGIPFTIPTITELYQAGVRFESVTTSNMFSISFKDGILKIPKISLNNQTETLLRNIIAFEQCHCKNLTISNFILLTRLVDTGKDLDLLIEYDIIDRAIGDHADVLMRIKTLAHEVAVDEVGDLFRHIFQDLKRYCKVPRHKWLTNLRHIYFNTPWTTISMIVATILLLLTFTQTIFSVLSFIFERQ